MSDQNGKDLRPIPMIRLHLDGEGCWPDLAVLPFEQVSQFEVAVVPNGTDAGRAAVTFRFDTEDGKVIIAQTTLRLLVNTVNVIRERYGDE